MGVSCSTPNSTTCDEIGLAVWLRRPAVGVEAEVGGRWLSLDDPQWSGPVRDHKRKMLAGFLHHAGLRTGFRLPAHWEGQPPRDRLLRARLAYSRARGGATPTRVPPSPGGGLPRAPGPAPPA